MKESDMTNIWQPNIQDWTKIDPDSANLFIAQAESRLKETTDTYNLTSTRTENYLAIVIALIAGAIGYIFAGEKPYLQATSTFALVPTLIAAYYLAKNLTQFTVYTVGDEPKAIFTTNFVDDFSGNNQYLNLVYYTMRSIQFKIDENRETNIKRVRNNAYARIALLTTPIAFLVGAIYQYLLGYQLVWTLPH